MDDVFTPENRKLLTKAQLDLMDFKKQNPNPRGAEALLGEELQNRVDLLKSLDQAENLDLGPTFDCVVFHDGEHWK